MCSMYKNGRKKTVFNEFSHALRTVLHEVGAEIRDQRSEIRGQGSVVSEQGTAFRFREGCFQSEAREFWLALFGWTACPGRELHFFLAIRDLWSKLS